VSKRATLSKIHIVGHVAHEAQGTGPPAGLAGQCWPVGRGVVQGQERQAVPVRGQKGRILVVVDVLPDLKIVAGAQVLLYHRVHAPGGSLQDGEATILNQVASHLLAETTDEVNEALARPGVDFGRIYGVQEDAGVASAPQGLAALRHQVLPFRAAGIHVVGAPVGVLAQDAGRRKLRTGGVVRLRLGESL